MVAALAGGWLAGAASPVRVAGNKQVKANNYLPAAARVALLVIRRDSIVEYWRVVGMCGGRRMVTARRAEGDGCGTEVRVDLDQAPFI